MGLMYNVKVIKPMSDKISVWDFRLQPNTMDLNISAHLTGKFFAVSLFFSR